MSLLEKTKHKFNMKMLDIIFGLIKIPSPDMFIGADSSRQMCRLIPAHGLKHVLLVSDKVLVGLNLMQGCVEELEKAGIKVTVFDNIGPNPTEEQIQDGINVARNCGCDAVLGFGGGSPMDAAKIISCGATNDTPLKQLEGAFKFKKPGLPLFLVPTTAGTGSEITIAGVVTSTTEERKYTVADTKVLPTALALDHLLMVGIPQKITAETGMDALTHAVEAYISTRANEKTKKASRIATKLIFQHLERAYQDGNDLEAREAMAYASFQGGVAIMVATGYVHGIAHQLGGIYHIPHGNANAVILPYVLDYSIEGASERLAELAEVIDLDVDGKTEMEKARMFIDAVKQLSQSVNIPAKFEEIKEEDVSRIYTAAQAEAMAIYGVPKYMPREDGEALIRQLIA